MQFYYEIQRDMFLNFQQLFMGLMYYVDQAQRSIMESEWVKQRVINRFHQSELESVQAVIRGDYIKYSLQENIRETAKKHPFSWTKEDFRL